MTYKKLASYRFLSILMVLVLLSVPILLSFPTRISAGALSKVKDTLEGSRPSTDANHTIQFVTYTQVDANTDTIILTFDDAGGAFNLTSLDYTDMDLAVDGDNACNGAWTDKTLAAAADADVWGVTVNTTNDTITFTAPTNAAAGEIAADRCVQIEIGDNATSGTTGDQLINNPAAQGSYYVDFSGAWGDTGSAVVAVVSTITAQVTVNESLSFTLAGVTAANCDDRTNKGTEIDTSATLVDFASPTLETFVDACQSLSVTTNAANGYSVTVVESDPLTSIALDTIADGTCDGTCSISSFDPWATNTNNGLGYCLVNKSGTDANAIAGEVCTDATPEFKIFPELNDETPETIMTNAGAVSGSNIHFGYRLSVSGTQEAGTYSNNIIFVATPTY